MVALYSVPSKTARILSSRLGIPIFYKDVPSEYTTIIRWGKHGGQTNSEKTINSSDAIYKANNKQLSRIILEHAGIAVPALTATKLPCIGRPLSHTQGNNFFYCETLDDITEACKKGAVYFSSYYPKTKEYRVHATPNKIIAIAEKVGGYTDRPAWNHGNNFYFKYTYYEDIEKEIRRIARHAVKALGLDFGAVDVMTSPTDDTLPEVVVCEVNTAPSLTNLAIEKYVKHINEMLTESSKGRTSGFESENLGPIPNSVSINTEDFYNQWYNW